MKKNVLLSCLLFASFINGFSDSGKDCGENCFSTTITKVVPTEDGCYNFSLEVSYTGDCTSALSHYTVETSCGTVTNLTNSENWKQEFKVTDPTTGIHGFKIDDIKNFGEEDGYGTFTVDFTICPDNSTCSEKLSCWAPVVAYKAGQCVYYDSLSYQCKKPLEANLISFNPNCADSNDGSIEIQITEGQGPFVYEWSTGDTSKILSGLTDGNYSVVIHDAHGDTLRLAAELIAPEPLVLDHAIEDISCEENSVGAISITASGGTGSYTYSWSNDSTGSSISNLAVGAYSVTVTDAAGCSINETFEINSSTQLSIQGTVSPTSCSENTGSIDISVNEGSGNYTYSWLDGATTEDREGLTAGFYTITVKDGACEATRTFSIKENNLLTVSGTIVPTGCPDDNQGGVTLTVSGATGELAYAWNNGQTGKDLVNVGAGRYEVIVSDETGCSITKSYYVFASSISVKSEVVHPTCFGDQNGSIKLTSDEDITVKWSSGEESLSLEGLTEGLYTATIQNASGCTNTYSYFVDAPEDITFTTAVENDNCSADGFSAHIFASGGTGQLTITWEEDQFTGAYRENLVAGNYNFIISDQNGCQKQGTVSISLAASGCPNNGDSGDNPTDEDTEGDGDNPTDGEDNGDNDDEGGSDTDDNPDDDGDNPDDGEENDGDDSDHPGDGEEGDNDEEGDGSEENPGDGNDEDGEDNPNVEDGDNPDDESEDDGENENPACSNPFDIELVLIEDGDCATYQATITYNGNKSFGLSHAVISASCGSLKGNYTDNGFFEYGSDPTTGLEGIKIDEVKNFGETSGAESFTFEFEICTDGCNDLESIDFTISYKYGQCVSYDNISVETNNITSVVVYPNPASDKLNFTFKQTGEPVIVELYNSYGLLVKERIFETGDQLQLDVNNLPKDFYTYRIYSGSTLKNGKVIISE